MSKNELKKKIKRRREDEKSFKVKEDSKEEYGIKTANRREPRTTCH